MNANAADTEVRLEELVALLERSIKVLSRAEGLRQAQSQLNVAVEHDNPTQVLAAVGEVRARGVDEIIALLGVIDEIDPHTLSEVQYRELMKKSPRALAEDALVHGKYRERRMLLQAKEAETNRRLARVAIGSAMVALSIPIIEKLLDLL